MQARASHPGHRSKSPVTLLTQRKSSEQRHASAVGTNHWPDSLSATSFAAAGSRQRAPSVKGQHSAHPEHPDTPDQQSRVALGLAKDNRGRRLAKAMMPDKRYGCLRQANARERHPAATCSGQGPGRDPGKEKQTNDGHKPPGLVCTQHPEWDRCQCLGTCRSTRHEQAKRVEALPGSAASCHPVSPSLSCH